MGGKARADKLDADTRKAIAASGGNALKARYGEVYFRSLGAKGAAARKKKREVTS